MSADEDTELRDLVAQTLEANGVLGKIRAQLRASVFLALEEQDSLQNKTPFANADLKQFISTKEGQMVTGLVREFLEHFNLEFTLAVFDPETGCGEHYSGRGALARDLNIVDSEGTRKLPLLAQVLKRSPNDSPSRSKSTSGAEATGGATSSVDNKNKRNLDGDKKDSKQAFKLPSTDTLQSDPDDDPFFDDPLPINNNTKVFSSDKQKKDVTFEDNASKKGASAGGASGLTSLAGLPSLTPSEQHNKPSKSPDLEKDIRAIDRKIADLGFDVPDDDYDDDFESSNVSPFGATPRSARSDHNVKSIEDELEDEIEEDLSVAEDLLRSDNSGMDDLTTDRTVSPDNQSSAIDYMEDVMVP